MRARFALLIAMATTVDAAPDVPDGQTLESQGAVIGRIVLDKSDVFDLSNSEENKALYRLANRLHIVTRDKIINQQLLFESGAVYSQRLVDESARILRKNNYLFDAEIKATRFENGVVDITVATRDVWSAATRSRTRHWARCFVPGSQASAVIANEHWHGCAMRCRNSNRQG